MPFFSLGGFTKLQSSALDDVANIFGATSTQVAQAWLLQRSPNILLISRTSSVAHLQVNLRAAEVVLTAEAVTMLTGIGYQSHIAEPVRPLKHTTASFTADICHRRWLAA